ncbi:Tim44 domain-containing protein [Legionella quateirensis]|uniref:Transmembrane protein n=1 Tax=Legionella quateirensis TaxID=45072 RepID=A0A378KQB7_9GAMM|nr:TIM44-like domain-containing protein [Legionella quateirensis]KTD44717.1 transmembrane protein [Legionella quateirensis]STY16765.1 transmembrane protein [Legionella quateirensis]
MRNLLSCFLIALLSFGLVINEASAKRFGGGRSFGVQRSQSSLFSSHKPQNTASMGQKANKSRWGGMLGGLLVGGLLASLFMGNGLANGLMTWLILGSVIFFAVSYLRRRMQPGFQSSQSNAFRHNSFNQFAQPDSNSSSSNSSHFHSNAVDFVSESFLRNAKVNFIRLQAAYDTKNLQDIQTFTTPEVFAEIKMQFDERGDEPNKTEVITLNAELLDVSKQTLSTIASVRFTGSIKENDEAIAPLDEIWHFYQFTNSKEWVVGGIQQEVYQP